MQGSQQDMLAQNCISMLQHRVQKQLQQQTEATSCPVAPRTPARTPGK